AHDGDARAIARRQELAAARAIAHFARRLGGNAPPLSDDIDISTPYAVERAAALAVAAFLIHVGRQPIRDVTGIRAPSREEVLRRLFVGTA
ncbi:MAG: hypothetical protein ISQ86_00775, partial [Alphaproteobacteria bacterium]|nr:hypothetical protein [Alphaproteobacteria bacterium]